MQLSKRVILISLTILVFTRPLICGVTFKWSNTLFQLLVLIMAMVWLLEMCLKGEFTFKKTAINLPLGVFFLFFIASIFRSVHLHESIVLTFQFLSYAFLYFVVANNVKLTSKKDINLLLFTLVAAYVLVVGYGYYQYFWGFEATREYVRTHPSAITSTPQFQTRLKDNAVFSFFVFAPALAGYLVVIFPILLSLIILSNKIWQRVSYFVILFAGIIILFLTYSKGGWLAFGLTLLLYLFIFQAEVLKKNKWNIHRGGKLILLCIIVAAIAISALYSINPARVPRLKNLLGSFNIRLQYWKAGVDMLKDRPLLGFGPGTFGSIYPRYKLPDAEETQLAHNNYIQIWVESGVFAFLAYMWLIFGFLICVFSNRKKMESARQRRTSDWADTSGGTWRRDENQILRMGLSLGIIAFLIHSIVDFNLYVPGISTFFWILLGLVSSSYLDNDYKISISNKSLRVITSFIIILGACLSTYLILMPLRAQIYANAAERYIDSVGKEPERLNAAIPLLQNAIKYDHTFSEYHFNLARTYETILDAKANRGEGVQDDEVRKVINSYENAIRYNYYMPFYHYRLGLLYWKWAGGKDKEKIDLAIKEFKTASWLYPTKQFYKQELEAIYKAIGGNE